MMDYWELRKAIQRVIPRQTRLMPPTKGLGPIKEKGRKKNYHEYRLDTGEFEKQEHLLNTEEVTSFLEVSIRAQACPMCLNLDIYDGLLCPYGCKYCYADNFRASLYTAFFDNSHTLGLRACNPDYYMRELDKLFQYWGTPPEGNPVRRAVSIGIPIRFGIRFEDFLPTEAKRGVSLRLLQYLAQAEYPVMINTKSDLVGREDYVRALADNPGRSAVHITMISSDSEFLRKLEPGAPSFEKRIEAAYNLSSAGVRVVARIEPYMVFINDSPDEVQEYMDKCWEAGIRNITFDTYSYSANNPGIRNNFAIAGYDFERMFLLGCDSQPIGSLLLGEFIKLFRARGFSCSTFDMGNVPDNDDGICCEVGEWFGEAGAGFNWGCSVGAVQFIKLAYGKAVGWADFEKWVNEHSGGFLSAALRRSVWDLWNFEGNEAYSPGWARNLESAGYDRFGVRWKAVEGQDFRWELLNGLL